MVGLISERFANAPKDGPGDADPPATLNLGCGTDIRPDCVNLDSAPLPGVDVVHDIGDLPLPFPDSRFETVICQDVLEHVDIVPTMRELHRIMRAGGTLDIRVPHFTSANTYADPTHRRAFSIDTFDFFCEASRRGYYFDFSFSAVVRKEITFTRSPAYFLGYAMTPIVNRSHRMQVFYERSVLRIVPAVNVEVRLLK